MLSIILFDPIMIYAPPATVSHKACVMLLEGSVTLNVVFDSFVANKPSGLLIAILTS